MDFMLCLVKYSNGGCSGFEPDFLLIYSVYNFSNRILIIMFFTLYHTGCKKSSKPNKNIPPCGKKSQADSLKKQGPPEKA